MMEQLRIIEKQMIPGTNLYRRWQSGSEISPEYQGDAQNELEAIAQAEKVGLDSVLYLGTLYVTVGGAWYCWSFPNDAKSLAI